MHDSKHGPSKNWTGYKLFDAQTRLAMRFFNMTPSQWGPVNYQAANRLQPAKKGSILISVEAYFMYGLPSLLQEALLDPKHMKLYYSLFISVVFPTHHVWPKKCSGLMAWDSVVLPSAPFTHKELSCLIEWLIDWYTEQILVMVLSWGMVGKLSVVHYWADTLNQWSVYCAVLSEAKMHGLGISQLLQQITQGRNLVFTPWLLVLEIYSTQVWNNIVGCLSLKYPARRLSNGCHHLGLTYNSEPTDRD